MTLVRNLVGAAVAGAAIASVAAMALAEDSAAAVLPDVANYRFLEGSMWSAPPSRLPAIAKYDFLEGSIWFVPPSTLPAIAFDLETGTATPIVDQTVWEINDYWYGYFWGRTAAQLRDAESGELLTEPSCLHMVGSVTPSGRVHITFVSQDQPTALTAIRGTGQLVRHRRGAWRFEEMQMSSGVTTVVVHWSYMVQCTPGEPCEARLPGTNGSLWDFLAACDG